VPLAAGNAGLANPNAFLAPQNNQMVMMGQMEDVEQN
jgi:hypothetical protein